MVRTRAVHLKEWANMYESRVLLPAVVRRLIRATVTGGNVVKFPAQEQVQLAGFDGIVEVVAGNQFVPAGKSIWEMGVNKAVKGKADDDYKKRTNSMSEKDLAETSFVFVTLRTWANKHDWVKARKEEGKWKDVIALDCDDLEHWIETAPAVDIWLSTKMGRRPEGILEPTQYWDALSQISEVRLAPEVFLCSREETISVVESFIGGPPKSVHLRSPGPDDGIDFLAAMIQSRHAVEPTLERVLFVTGIEAWRYLAISQEPSILVATNSLRISATDISEAVASGHYVIISGSHVTSAATSSIELPRQEHFALFRALADCGFDDAHARRMSQGCCGSSTILKRLITKHADRAFPRWSQDEFRVKLAPFALIGGWLNVAQRPPISDHPLGFVERSPLDLWLLEQFGFKESELDELVTRWSSGDEPLFICVGNVVFVSSREDAWYLLAGSLSRNALSKFEDIAVLILDEDNPSLDLDPGKRWMASLYGKVHSLSSDLRNSIVETLALMASYPVADHSNKSVEFRKLLRRVCNHILPENASWKRWASLGKQLPLLFEADPEFFLSRVESDLQSGDPQVLQLFESSGQGITSTNFHCHLLWALEGLAWSHEYLGRTALILARLASRIRTKSGNNPLNSLSEIFRLWMPHTNATVTQRIDAIKHIVKAEAVTGWLLIKELLPDSMPDTSMMTQMPRWRPWAHGWTRHIASGGLYEYTTQLVEQVMQLADCDAGRWSQILEGMIRASSQHTERILKRLDETAALHTSNTDQAYDLWKTLCQVTCRHGRFSDSNWAFSPEVINRLAMIRDQLVPRDPVLKHEWLFADDVHLPGVDATDWETHDNQLTEHRVHALASINASQRTNGIFQLVERIDRPCLIGWLLGEYRLLSPSEVGIPSSLFSDSGTTASLVRSYCTGRFKSESWAFINALNVSMWSSEEAAILGACIPFSRPTWDWIARISPEAEEYYWQQCYPSLGEASAEDIDFVIEHLLKAGRLFAACKFLYSYERQDSPTDSKRILGLLEAGLNITSVVDSSQVCPFPIQVLIGKLQRDKTIDELRLAKVEWGYLGLLDRSTSETEPATLFRLLGSTPSLFVDLLTLIYRAEDEEPGSNPISGCEHQMVPVAIDLLDRFEEIPGMRVNGTIDGNSLKAWVLEAQRLAECVNRGEDCDRHIGELLAHVDISDELPQPFETIVNILEEIGSQIVLDAFEHGVIYSRGVVVWMPTSGGDQERQLVEMYSKIAAHLRLNASKVAEVFDRIAMHYDNEASMNDIVAERTRLGR